MPVYFVHLSGRDAVAALDRARAHWPRVYRETCPHYLFHNVEGLVPAVKFSPPVPPSRRRPAQSPVSSPISPAQSCPA